MHKITLGLLLCLTGCTSNLTEPNSEFYTSFRPYGELHDIHCSEFWKHAIDVQTVIMKTRADVKKACQEQSTRGCVIYDVFKGTEKPRKAFIIAFSEKYPDGTFMPSGEERGISTGNISA
jgi:hypothetical protein